MKVQLISLIAFLAVLVGCPETPIETAAEVAEARRDAAEDTKEARQDANEDVAGAIEVISDAHQAYDKTNEIARRKLTDAESEAMVKAANADFDVATTEAKGGYDVAKAKCGALNGVDETACVSTADATLATNQAKATAIRDAALVNAEHHE